MSQSILSNTAVATIGRVINLTLGIAITALLTRQLGVAAFGSYAVVLSYGALLQLAADCGLYLTLTREIAKDPQRESLYVSHVMSLRICLFLLCFGIGGILALFLPTLSELLPVLLLVTVSLLFQSLSQLLMGVYQKYSNIWRATIGDLMGRVAQIIAIVSLSFFAVSVVTMTVALLIGTLIAFLCHYWLLPPTIRYRPSFSWPMWQRLLKLSWPLGVMLLLNAIYFRIDTVILSMYHSAVQVGHYGLAYKVIESGLFFPAMFGGLLLPRLTEAWRRNHKLDSAKLLTESLQVALVAAAFVGAVLLTIPEAVVVFVAGPDFLPAARLLQILSLALMSMFFGNIFGFTLVAFERQKILVWLYASLALLNVILNLIFIPRGGAIAAAWTTVVTEGLATCIAAIVVWRLSPYALPLRLLLKVGVVAGATMVVLLLTRDGLPVIGQIILATCFYVLGSLLVRTVSQFQFRLLISPPVP